MHLEESILSFIAFYVVAVVTVLVFTTLLRCTYWRFTEDPIPLKRAFVYGILYARTLGLLGCASGLLGSMLLYSYHAPLHYSFLAIPILPLVYSVFTTKRTRWQAYME